MEGDRLLYNKGKKLKSGVSRLRPCRWLVFEKSWICGLTSCRHFKKSCKSIYCPDFEPKA